MPAIMASFFILIFNPQLMQSDCPDIRIPTKKDAMNEPNTTVKRHDAGTTFLLAERHTCHVVA